MAISHFSGVSASTTVTTTQELDNGNSGATATIDWNDAQNQKITLTANVTLTFTDLTEGTGVLHLKLIQDDTGNRTATWPNTVNWAGGTAPTLTTDADAVDLVSLYFDGTNYYGSTIFDLQ